MISFVFSLIIGLYTSIFNLIFLQLYMGQSLAEFSMKWSHWQQECKHRLDNETFAGHPPLHTICKVWILILKSLDIFIHLILDASEVLFLCHAQDSEGESSCMARSFCCVLGQGMLFSQCLSPLRPTLSERQRSSPFKFKALADSDSLLVPALIPVKSD